jgi:hypothetical protein
VCCITQLSASSRRITQDEYDKKARELKQRQAEIALRIEQHQEGDGHFRATLESLISLASRAAELFERSKIEQKRELIAFVFSNLRLRGKTLEFSLRSPFDLMVNLQGHSGWLGDLDSNQDWRSQSASRTADAQRVFSNQAQNREQKHQWLGLDFQTRQNVTEHRRSCWPRLGPFALGGYTWTKITKVGSELGCPMISAN